MSSKSSAHKGARDPEQPCVLLTEGPIFAFDCIALLLHRDLPGVRKRVNNGVEKEDRDDCGGDPHRPIAPLVEQTQHGAMASPVISVAPFSSTETMESPAPVTIPISAA